MENNVPVPISRDAAGTHDTVNGGAGEVPFPAIGFDSVD